MRTSNLISPKPRNKQRICSIALIFNLVLIAAIGCEGQPNDQSQSAKPKQFSKQLSKRVVAVNYALQYLAQRIAGDEINVELPFSDSVDPGQWRPDRQSILKLQSADRVVANGTGATYAKWLATVSVPESKMINAATKGMSLRDYIQIHDIVLVHTHGPEGEHSHPTMVAETWLDPTIALKQATFISKELSKVYPKLSATFEANLDELATDLQPLVDRLDDLKSKSESLAPIVSNSPKLKFLTRAAGVTDHHLTWQELPSKEQAQSDLAKKIKALSSAGSAPQVMLWASQFSEEKAKKQLAKSGIDNLAKANNLKIVNMNTIEVRPESGDFLTVLTANIDELESSVQ